MCIYVQLWKYPHMIAHLDDIMNNILNNINNFTNMHNNMDHKMGDNLEIIHKNTDVNLNVGDNMEGNVSI